MINKLMLLGNLVLMLTLTACQSQGPVAQEETASMSSHSERLQQREQAAVAALSWLASADPQRDVSEAISNGNYKLLGIAGRPLRVPGVEAAQLSQLQVKCPVQVISGTGDVVLGEQHRRLREKAVAYATEFNRLMMSHCL